MYYVCGVCGVCDRDFCIFAYRMWCVLCGGLGSGVWMWDVAADANAGADRRTTFNVCPFVRTRPEN